MKIDRLQNDERLRQFVRFGVVGVLSSAVHYAIYYLLLFVLTASFSYIIGYLVSFVGNYFFTNCYTFRTKPSWKHFAGFAGSHAVNFGLHVVLFNIFLWLGMHQLVIPVFVMGICVIVQFTILRWVFTKHE
jgi:putative flippase GtrA